VKMRHRENGRASASLYRARVVGGDQPVVAQSAPLMASIFGPKGKWRGREMGSRGGGRSASFHRSIGGTRGGLMEQGGGGVMKTGGSGFGMGGRRQERSWVGAGLKCCVG
jgi:hypothetical protein